MTWAEAVRVALKMGYEWERKFAVIAYRSGDRWCWYPVLAGGRSHLDHIVACDLARVER